MLDNKKYIYNPMQAQFYMINGVRPLMVDVHTRTHKTFWVFDYNQTKEVYLKWLNNKAV